MGKVQRPQLSGRHLKERSTHADRQAKDLLDRIRKGAVTKLIDDNADKEEFELQVELTCEYGSRARNVGASKGIEL